jgi:hypothetical protein
VEAEIMNEHDRLLYFYYERLQAVRRAHKHYFALLLLFLGFVWVFYWFKPPDSRANFLGVPLNDRNLLGITPAVSTILLLGLIGSSRAIRPALESLRKAWKSAGGAARLDLEALDNHQNWVDYLMFLWVRPFGEVIYAAAILGTMASTIAVGLTLAPQYKGYVTFLFATYSLLCLAFEGAAAWKWFAERLAVLRHHP